MTKRLRILALGLMIVVLLATLSGCSEQMGSIKDAVMGVKDKIVAIFTPYLPGCEHEGGEATCTEQAVCSICGEAYGDVLGHDIVIDAAVAPDCTNTGLTEGKHCTRCDYVSGQEAVDALGHIEVVDAAVPATCYSTGLTEGKHCDRCGEVLVAQTTTTMIPHTYDEEGFDETCNAEGCTHVRTCAHDSEKTVVPGKAPTCTTAGLTDGETCAICGDVTKAQEVIDALSHDMADATCTQPATCKREGCGHTVGAAKGHSYNGGVVITAPTCTEKGVKTYTCSACGDSYTEEVKANGHDYAVTVVPSTCIAQGYTNHDCKNCDDSYNDNYTALADHTYDAGVVTTAPTCTEDGEKTYTCTLEGCGHSYTEVVRTEGHATVAHEGKAATCTEDGWEAYVTCENCDYTTYKVITSTGHSGGKATCKSLAVCSTCGETYGNYDTVNGHDYGEADCDSPATCKLCGKTSGEAIGHADDNKDHKCDRCDAPQGEHVDTDSNHVCDYGCSEPIGVCEDANKDHACDYGCGKEYGDHADSNRDHACDYGCSVPIGKHSDGTDTNHTCDHGCTEPVEGEVCVDDNKDHKCDECSAKMSDCADTDKDHRCDVCGVTLTECADKNNDHNCDVCDKKLTDCDDDNGDHYCDLCDEKVSECADTNRDHNCDLCGETVSVCADDDANHSCDVCGKELSKCADNDNDHKCDLCDEVVSECADNNNDHNCDVCTKKLTDCADNDNNHKCDVCGKTVSECADNDNNHKCDVCGNTVSECADNDKNHKCDVCGTTLTECSDVDTDADHDCDVCGETIGECSDVDPYDHECDVCGKTVSECADNDNNHKCDVCGDTVSECADSDKNHKCDVCGETVSECADGDNNHKCDICGTTLSECVDADGNFKCDTCSKLMLPAADSTLTIEQALKIGVLTTTEGKYYLTGTITGFYGNSATTYGNVYIEDANGKSILVYGLYSADGSTRYDSMAVKPSIGDTITVYGILTSYNGTAQMKDAWMTEYVPHTCQWSEATCETLATCSVCGATTGEFGEHNYIDGECSVCGNPEGVNNVTVSKTHTEIAGIAGVTVGENTGLIDGKNIALDGYISIVCAKAKSSTAPCIYDESIRLYQNGATLTVKAADGATMKTIVITLATKSGGQGPITVVGGTASAISNYKYTITVNSGVSEVVITTAGTDKDNRLYVASIEVSYAEEVHNCADYAVDVVAKDATCTEDGNTAGTQCSKCSRIISGCETIPATGHDYTATPATCTTNAKCACGEEKVNSATGHKFVDGQCACGEVENTKEPESLAEFTLGANGSASHSDGSSKTAYTETVNGMTLTLSSMSKVYTGARDAKGNSCIKLGTSSAVGSFKFTVPENVTEVVIYVAKYKANTTKITVNGDSYTISGASNSGAYDAIVVDTSVNKTVTFTTVSGSARCMINTIEFIGYKE